MKLSVIVTTWKCEPWIDACRASILAARAVCSADVEIVEVCSGCGVSQARNDGLAKASGDWIVFVDGDDLVSPDFMKEIIRNVANADLIRFRFANFSGEEDFRECKPCRPFPFGWTACAYHRSVIPKAGFEPYLCGEDTLFLLECLRTAKRIVDVDKVVYGYRQRLGSATSSQPTVERFVSRRDYGVVWFSRIGNLVLDVEDVKRARHLVARDVVGGMAVEVRRIVPNPWSEWFSGVDRLLGTGTLPWNYVMALRVCRIFRRHWMTWFMVELPIRVAMKFGG